MAKNRKNFALTRELMQTHVMMMEGLALQNYRTRILHNFNNHISAEDLADETETERHYMVTYNKVTHEATRLQFFNESNILCEYDADGNELVAATPSEDEERVLMLEMCGPVTRCGGMCSYGSIDFRDILLEYAEDPSVVGFVLITDTPGGTAFALHDFKQGIDAWNAAGKRSIQWIDGMSCSAGVALGSQCQRVIAMNGKDTIGCVGAMMAGWMTADGTIDSDGNRFIDITASQTPDKNGEFRAAAAGDYEALQAEVDACATDFLDLLAEVRPQIPDDQKTGHTYDAQDVIGTFLDGLGTLDDATHYALTGEENWNTISAQPGNSGEPGTAVNPDPAKDPDLNPDEDPDYDPTEDPDAPKPPHQEGQSPLPTSPKVEEPQSAKEQHEEGTQADSEASQPRGPEASQETATDNNENNTPMTQIEAQRIATATGMTIEQVMSIATTEEAPAQEQTEQPAQTEQAEEQTTEHAEQTDTPAEQSAAEGTQAEGTQTEQPAEGEAANGEQAQQTEGEQTEQHEEPAAEGTQAEGAQTEQPATEGEAMNGEPAQQAEGAQTEQHEEPTTEGAQTEQPAATVPEGSPSVEASALAALQQQMAALQQQLTAMQSEHQVAIDNAAAQLAAAQQQAEQAQQQAAQAQQQAATANSALAAAQQEARQAQQEAATLRSAAPAPAMPAAPAHAPSASTASTRISEGMTPAEKLAAYKKRGEQLKRNR